MSDVSVILLAGGRGERFGSRVPKQFVSLCGKPIALHSLEIFLKNPAVAEVIVVCDAEFKTLFSHLSVEFADPGTTRQESLFQGFKKSSPLIKWICVHDAARPFISSPMLETLFAEGKKEGAAVVGMPVKWTVKEIDQQERVVRTLEREKIWEIQTPQFLRRDILEMGRDYVKKNNLTVTDDVSLAELIGHPVKIVRGSYKNLKITTPDDLSVAEYFARYNAEI